MRTGLDGALERDEFGPEEVCGGGSVSVSVSVGGEGGRLTVAGHESAWNLECRFAAVCVEAGDILIISDQELYSP